MTIALAPHPAQKDSGISWLGKIPAHWSIVKLSRRYSVQLGKMLDEKRITGAHLVPYLRNVDVQWDRISVQNLPEMDIEPHEYERYTLQAGDMLVCEGGEVGRSAFWRADLPLCGYQKALHRLRAYDPEQDNPRFLYYVMNYAAQSGVFTAHGNESTIAHLTAEKLRAYRFAFPSKREQDCIAAYLDHLGRLVSRFIRAKRRLIELLNEQKQAIIHQAVTRGLDPDAPRKPSGVDWLGDIPAHWELSTIKREFYCLDRQRIPLSSVERGAMTSREYDYYGASGVIDKVENYLFDDELILLAEDGANLVLRNLPLSIVARGRFWVNNHAHVLKPKCGDLEYFSFLLETIDYRPWITGAAQPKLTGERLLSIAIAVPEPAEQRRITAAVQDRTMTLTTAISRATSEVALIREFRTRLIADVVTGKLDVRDVAAQLLQTSDDLNFEIDDLLEVDSSDQIDDVDDGDTLDQD